MGIRNTEVISNEFIQSESYKNVTFEKKFNNEVSPITITGKKADIETLN